MKISSNVLWNVSGAMLPLLVGVAVIPGTVRNLGVGRFGILSVIWMIIGYFSIFDLGLSRTLTKVTADRVGTPEEVETPTLVTTTLILVAAVSVTFSCLLAAASGTLVHRVLHVPPATAADTCRALVWLAVSLPVVLLSTVLFGALEGYQKFDATNAVRLPLGILMFLIPYAVSCYAPRLSTITAALFGLRLVVLIVLAAISMRVMRVSLSGQRLFRRDQIGSLLAFGGWLTVSNIVGPLLVYFDRFMIALLLGSAAIAYYTVPFDALYRILILPTAIQGVLFPAFAALRRQPGDRIARLFKRSSDNIFLAIAPVVLAVVLLGRPGLEIWMGADFASRSFLVAQVLAIGVLFNALARTPIMLVQGYGRAKWTGVLHALELPGYAVALWVLLRHLGIEGAALAWTARVAADCVVLYGMAIRLEPGIKACAARDLLILLAVSTVAVGLWYAMQSVILRSLTVVAIAAPCGVALMLSVKAALSGSRPQMASGARPE
jgi:O-antigen/teichoic acid export membrane protein